jgi:hypothetical protein
MTKLCYIHLPYPQFTTLQKRIFPIYFTLQTTLVAATVVTYPSGSLLALAANRGDAVILGVTFGVSMLNLFVFGPRTSELMVEKSHQGTMISSSVNIM